MYGRLGHDQMEIHKKAAELFDKIYKIYGNNLGEVDKESWIRGYVQGWTDGDMNGYKEAREEMRDSEIER